MAPIVFKRFPTACIGIVMIGPRDNTFVFLNAILPVLIQITRGHILLCRVALCICLGFGVSGSCASSSTSFHFSIHSRASSTSIFIGGGMCPCPSEKILCAGWFRHMCATFRTCVSFLWMSKSYISLFTPFPALERNKIRWEANGWVTVNQR